ncbi:MAG: hypothetical protein ROM03_09665, partial [Mucispirillum sp.]|nr:hypothetical protein [Mucispirillum sp.]
MKKLFIIPLFLILLSCANDSSNTENIEVTTPLVSENALILGVNQVNYDKNKTFTTLIYQARNPVNEDYQIRNSYSISANMQQQERVTQDAVLPKKFSVEKGAKENLIDINKDMQQYALANNINPIDKNSSSLYRTIPQTVEVGTKWENIYLLDPNSSTPRFQTINATCIAVSEKAYFFLQDGLADLTDEQITEITTSFDKDYNIVHQYYGEETDTDGNGKVSFLIANFSQGLFGFFTSVDKYAPQDIPAMYKTNEADVLYVNYYYFKNDWEKYQTDLKATLIHEFQHMVLFDSRSRLGLNPDVNVWLNEGLSMLSEYYGGYAAPHYRYIGGYFEVNQGISLITDSSSQDYGLSYLFARYLQIRFGDSFIKKIYTSQYTDIRAVEEAVNMDFNELFLDFIKMILVTGRNVTTDTRYNIEEFNYPEGSEGYNRNGFNLASVIDEVYSLYSRNNYFITSTGYNNKSLEMCGFTITKWNGNIDNITLSSSS